MAAWNFVFPVSGGLLRLPEACRAGVGRSAARLKPFGCGFWGVFGPPDLQKWSPEAALEEVFGPLF